MIRSIKLWWKRRRLRKKIKDKWEDRSLAYLVGANYVAQRFQRDAERLEKELRDTYDS